MIHDSIVAVVVITAVDYIKNMEVPRNFVSTVYWLLTRYYIHIFLYCGFRSPSWVFIC